MLPDKWIIDRTPTKRFPSYTRGNAADVLADPVSPLGWTFAGSRELLSGAEMVLSLSESSTKAITGTLLKHLETSAVTFTTR